MKFRERHPSDKQPGPEDQESSQLQQKQADGNAMLEAAQNIIESALSGNSAAFLQANRQQSGQ